MYIKMRPLFDRQIIIEEEFGRLETVHIPDRIYNAKYKKLGVTRHSTKHHRSNLRTLTFDFSKIKEVGERRKHMDKFQAEINAEFDKIARRP